MESVIITGASSGIGRALAHAWAARGAKMILSARNEDALKSVAREVQARGGTAIVDAGDVTQEGYARRLIDRATGEFGQLDVLVNNAGRGYYGSLSTVDLNELRSIFELNVIAPLRLSQLAMEPLARTSGTIVMISSVAGVAAAPRLGAYAASKYALEALSLSMRAELGGRDIRVVVIRPGPVDTPFRAHALATDVKPGVRLPGSRVQTAEQIAEQTLKAVDRGTPVVETSLFAKLASFAARSTPAAYRLVTRKMASRNRNLA